jgi:nicotinamide mononucleotide transporter
MFQVFDFFFSQYSNYSTVDFYLEVIAVFFGLLSVWYAKNNNIYVYPTGIISTGIFIYLLFNWGLLGDLTINIYYFSMSIYGWYFWNIKDSGKIVNKITSYSKNEKVKVIIIMFLSIILVVGLYIFFDKWDNPIAWIDTVTTSLFFAGMWLMAKRKLEHWIFWIIGDIISIPLYLYKGLMLTSFQYLIFTILAVKGYKEWRNILVKKNQNV